MTEIEAIKIFNTVIAFGKCDLSGTDGNEVLYMAIHALEKQIPKKPYWRIEEDVKGYAACPTCNMGVTIDHGRIREAFCSSCGQKLDWSKKG